MNTVLRGCAAFATSILLPALQRSLAAGEKADLVVVTAPAMDALQKENRVAARAFLRALASATGRAAFTSAGLEPLVPAP